LQDKELSQLPVLTLVNQNIIGLHKYNSRRYENISIFPHNLLKNQNLMKFKDTIYKTCTFNIS
jgi:hypothetical protein